MQPNNVNISRAELLLEQGRISDAVKELKSALQQDPDNAYVYALYARCHYAKGEYSEGLNKIQQAISLEPDEAYYFYLRGFAYYHLNQLAMATTELNKAISLYPYHAEYFGLYAFVLLDDRKYELALAKANEGLELDPENVTSLNARARALNKLKRTDEAVETMQDALSNAPESDFTHVTIGFNHLERGKHKEAQQHFREALRLSPNLHSAKEGLKEALKANFPPYRFLLQLGFWLAEKGQGFRIGFSIGLYILFRFVTSMASSMPGIRWILVPFIVLYLLYVSFSWIGSSVANFILLFHKDGKYILNNWERYTAIAIVCLLLSGITLGSVAYINNLDINLTLAGVILATMCMPVSRFEDGDTMTLRSVKAIFTSALILTGITAVALSLLSTTGAAAGIVTGAYFVGLIIYTWTSGGWN
ncbi:tetratricopeptide repeat protein [Lacibacter luteus]|uniref:Tetratricopeptide repeat protein n=1 Tax=Lacibacter luteus TaxID=2508719 RepID=A0A4V1M7X4_9BACT|nr:tetratricopeptide repeat protein [Lacibacter luteus]RXK61862.1 tetratricopeptide repeat protein [Lacibacter luteus]